MDDLQLPSGRYLSCAIDVHADNAGQTKALLMRNRIFAARTGVVPSILSFGASNDIEERRAVLLERGLLDHGVDLLNIFEHYRDTDWPGDLPTGRPLEDLGRFLTRETALADGSPWRRTYRRPGGTSVYDYLRPDGTVFLRIPAFVFREAGTWPTSVLRVSRAGEVVGEYSSPRGWYQQWLRELAAPHERTFVFCDSRFLAPFLAPMEDPSIHVVYLLHNIHLMAPHRWDSETGDVHERLLGLVGDFDAFLTLTERQRDDVAERVGRRSNMFVVPNPVDMPPMPEQVRRDPHQVTMMARLVTQKQPRQAVAAMREVVEQVPEAHLDIFGDGPRMATLEDAVELLGVEDSVTLRGHDPHARESLWRSSVYLMTSAYEGYPLSTLESLSHGCPVVSYDIKYGPREQITEGVDGFLVPVGDVSAMAARVTTLLKDPALVQRMSEAARKKAAQHGYDRFLADWQAVLRGVVDLKDGRTTIEDGQLDVQQLGVEGSLAGGRRLDFRGRLTLQGHSKTARLEDATLTLSAIHEPSSAVVDVPLQVRPTDRGFDLSAAAALEDLYPRDGDGRDAAGRARLRLRVVWNNSAWETVLRRTAGQPPWTRRTAERLLARRTGIEVSYGPDGELTLVRR